MGGQVFFLKKDLRAFAVGVLGLAFCAGVHVPQDLRQTDFM
jgi:hypothetical protein